MRVVSVSSWTWLNREECSNEKGDIERKKDRKAEVTIREGEREREREQVGGRREEAEEEKKKRKRGRRGGTVSEKAQPPARRLLGSEYGKAGVG